MIQGTITGVGRQETKRGRKGPFKVQEVQVRTAAGKKHRFSLVDRAALSESLKGQLVSLEGYRVHNNRIYLGREGTLALGNGHGHAPAPSRPAPAAKPQAAGSASAAADRTKPATAGRPDRFAEACGFFLSSVGEVRRIAGDLELSKNSLLAMTMTLSIYKQKHRANGHDQGTALLGRCFDFAKRIGRELALSDDEVAKVADHMFIGLTRNGF